MYISWRKFTVYILITFSFYYGFAYCGKVKRSLLDLGDMILFTTGRPSLDFNKYGNFCGKGGTGQVMDRIDLCCNLHDRCYGMIHKRKCHVYTKSYNWLIVKYRIICRNKNLCQRASCECDKNLAYCLGRFRGYYNQYLASRSKFQNFIRRAGHFLTNNRF